MLEGGKACCAGAFEVVGLLGGSWVVISGVTSPLIWFITILTLLLITPLITTHEPPSRQGFRFRI